MEFYDVTLPLSADLPAWPGDPSFEMEPVSLCSKGDGFNVSALRLGTHTGTHVDAPRHLADQGMGVDQLPFDVLIGDAWVCRLPDSVGTVTAEALAASRVPEGTRRLLIATRNGDLWNREPRSFARDYVALSRDAAEWVVDRGILLLGVDYISVDPMDADEPAAHRVLLSQGVVVVEGLDLRRVAVGGYRLVCLPLRVVGGDGAPARVVLLREP